MARPEINNMVDLTPSELQLWLEWAGARLIAMPGGHVGPAELKVIWPEYSQDKFQVLEFRKNLPIRAAAPSSVEIPFVDEILTLPNICAFEKTRRVLHARLLVHPINGRYRYTWRKIGILVESDHKTVKNWHRKGLEEVITKTNPEQVCRIWAFFESLRSSPAISALRA